MAIGAGAVAAPPALITSWAEGAQHQKKAKVWMVKMETEVAKKLKNAKSVTQPLYREAVDTIAATYSKQYKEHVPEIKALAKKLKEGWKDTKNKARKL